MAIQSNPNIKKSGDFSFLISHFWRLKPFKVTSYSYFLFLFLAKFCQWKNQHPQAVVPISVRVREREREGERNQKRALLEVAADLSQVFSIKSVLTRLAIFLPQLRRTEEDKGWTWWYCVPSLTEQKLTHPINGFWCTDSSSFSKFMAVVINPWHTGNNWLVICCTRMKNFRRDSWRGIALHSLVKELVTYVQQQD
jgi:hypothetical protein